MLGNLRRCKIFHERKPPSTLSKRAGDSPLLRLAAALLSSRLRLLLHGLLGWKSGLVL